MSLILKILDLRRILESFCFRSEQNYRLQASKLRWINQNTFELTEDIPQGSDIKSYLLTRIF